MIHQIFPQKIYQTNINKDPQFHLDTLLGKKFGDLVKESWVANFFKCERGNDLYIARKLDNINHILGFLLTLEIENILSECIMWSDSIVFIIIINAQTFIIII